MMQDAADIDFLEPDAPPPGRRRWWPAIGGCVLFLLLAAGAIVYFLVPGMRGSEPENTAKYFPEDTVIYSWATLSPGIGQGAQMRELWNRLKELPGFEEAVDGLLEDADAEVGIDFKQQVLPWIGPDVSMGMLNPGAGDPTGDFVVLIGVRDHSAASAFVHDLSGNAQLDGMSLGRGDSIHGFEVRSDWDAGAGIALSSDWLVMASSEAALNDVAGLVADQGQRSLADSERFRHARSALRDERAMSAYLDLEAVVGLASELSADAEISNVGAGAFGDSSIPDWLAMSVGFVDLGIVIEWASPIGAGAFGDIALDDEPAALLPENTVFFGAAAFEPDMDRWRTELSTSALADILGAEVAHDLAIETGLEADSTLAELLDDVVEVIDDELGINLEDDLFDLLGGQAVIGIRDFDIERIADLESYAVDVMAAVSYVPGGEEGLRRTVDKLVDLLEEAWGESFPPRASKDIGADHDAVTLGGADFEEATAYSPSYVFHDGHMTVASTERALRSVVDAQNGDRGTLAATREYRRVRDGLPDTLELLVYLDLHRIVTGLDPDALGIDPENYRVLESVFGAVGVGISMDGDYARASLVMTLVPQ